MKKVVKWAGIITLSTFVGCTGLGVLGLVVEESDSTNSKLANESVEGAAVQPLEDNRDPERLNKYKAPVEVTPVAPAPTQTTQKTEEDLWVDFVMDYLEPVCLELEVTLEECREELEPSIRSFTLKDRQNLLLAINTHGYDFVLNGILAEYQNPTDLDYLVVDFILTAIVEFETEVY